jgi:hypothetical protein
MVSLRSGPLGDFSYSGLGQIVPELARRNVNAASPVTGSLSPSDASPGPVPVRMLNEYAYRPRLGYLMWVQGEFADSADTVEGRLHHRVVDRERKRSGKENSHLGR